MCNIHLFIFHLNITFLKTPVHVC